jgi:hypothetical protein
MRHREALVMAVGRTHSTSFGRAAELFGLSAALLATFVCGLWVGQRFEPSSSQPQTNSPVASSDKPRSDETTAEPSRSDAPRSKDSRRAESHAEQARSAAIARDAAAIQAECQRAAGGDWEKWQRDTAPYRADLAARLAALKELPGVRAGVLEGIDGFPLFEIDAKEHLNYLHDASTLDAFRRDRPVVAASRWLRQRGIDLIFVPIPKMTEIYSDRILRPCPPDGIIAPHVRRAFLELLNEDVELVDALRLFRSLRDTDSEYLCNPTDTHWAPRGMRIMAKEIAGRIERYHFGARARYALPIVQVSLAPYLNMRVVKRLGGLGGAALTPEQKLRAELGRTQIQSQVSMPSGGLPPEDPGSPVLVIGHSYNVGFREQLVKELNLLTYTRFQPSQTTEGFADFLREPELLDHCRVIVWITTDQHFTRFKPMPQPIMQVLESGK